MNERTFKEINNFTLHCHFGKRLHCKNASKLTPKLVVSVSPE